MGDPSTQTPPQQTPVDVPLVAATFVNHMFTFGVFYSFGVFLPPMKVHFNTGVDAITPVHSVMLSMQFFGSLLAGLLIPVRLRHRTVAGASSVLVLAGYLLAASIDSLPLLYLCMAFVGLGLGASNLAGLTALATRSKERRALAVGIATCGTNIGTILFAPLSSFCISALGWRWAFRLSGFAAALALGATAPFFWVPDSLVSGAATAARSPLLPCRDARYFCWWLNMCISMLGFFTVPTLLAQYAQDDLGLTPEAASIVYTVFGACGLLTRGSLGPITSLVGSSRRVHLVSQLAVGVATAAVPLCRSIELLIVWGVFFGLSLGPVIPLIGVIISELFGVAMLPLLHGFSRLAVGIGGFVGPPLIGAMVEGSGYGVAFVVAGALIIMASGFLFLLDVFQKRHLKKLSELDGAERSQAPKALAGQDDRAKLEQCCSSGKGEKDPSNAGKGGKVDSICMPVWCCPLFFCGSAL